MFNDTIDLLLLNCNIQYRDIVVYLDYNEAQDNLGNSESIWTVKSNNGKLYLQQGYGCIDTCGYVILPDSPEILDSVIEVDSLLFPI